jgi:flavin reductase (DIM6/NTAB) family NADH-FMN oxidoreductase RutF
MNDLSPDVDAITLRRVFSSFPSGVVALAPAVADRREVLIASSFSVGVSQDPPLVMFAVQNTSATWPRLARATHLGVSVLGEPQLGIGRQLAEANPDDRFTGVPTTVSEHGAVFLADAPAWLECRIEQEHPAGDHRVVILRVLRTSSVPDARPIVFHGSRFRQLA